jgi:hypothetical protein
MAAEFVNSVGIVTPHAEKIYESAAIIPVILLPEKFLLTDSDCLPSAQTPFSFIVMMWCLIQRGKEKS